MAEGGFSGQVILCWPSDRAAIARLNAGLTPEQQFAPTVNDSLSTCDACQRSIWIAEQQKQMLNSPFVHARKLCMFCVGGVQQALGFALREVDLGAGMHARRRTA